MTNPITPQRTIRLAVPAVLLPPGLRPGPDGKVELPLNFARRDFANAEWRLKTPLLGPHSAEFWQSGCLAYQTGILLFVGLQRVLPRLTPDDAHDLIPYEGSAEIETEIMDAVRASFPTPKADEPQEAGEAVDPLASPTGGTEPGASPESVSA